jgi:hypothetical protein
MPRPYHLFTANETSKTLQTGLREETIVKLRIRDSMSKECMGTYLEAD